MILTTVIKSLLPNFLGRAIVILNFVRRFRNLTLRKTLTTGLGLDDMSLAWPAVVQLLVFCMAMSPSVPHMGYTYLTTSNSHT